MKKKYLTPELVSEMLYLKNIIAASGLREESEGEGESGEWNDLFG